jgi:hemolysin III
MTRPAHEATAPHDATAAPKPRWRGVQHQWAAAFAAGAGVTLVALAPTTQARAAAAIYAASLTLLLTVSGIYHGGNWRHAVRMWLRRADHASIFLLIGGTYTPVAMLGLDDVTGRQLLIAIWSGVALGIVVSMFWPGAPKFVSAAIAVAVGWTIVPYLGDLGRALSTVAIWLIAAGGIAYTVGAIVYAVKRPNPWPASFGYHEVFHALTLLGAGLHFAAIILLVRAHVA